MKSIFVSSTFKDMQTERNLIRFKVMPEINEFLKDYGETIDFIDLRWGIDTTDYLYSSEDKQKEGEKKVLKVCLDEISKTPYFIAILGYRYGWIPDDDEEIEQVINILNSENKTNYKKPEKKISVTDLEIDYGAFFRKHPENCIFYMRNIVDSEDYNNLYYPENDSEIKDVLNLQTKIEKKFSDRVRTYNAKIDKKTNEIIEIDDLAKMIIEDVKEIIKRDFKKNPINTWQERKERDIQYIIDKKTSKFAEQKEILKQIDDFIEDKKRKRILLLTGEAGAGKSTICCQLYNIYKNKFNIIPFFIDNTANSSNALDIIKYQLYQIYKILNIHNVSPKAFEEYINNSKVYIEPVYSEGKIIGINKITYSEEPPIRMLQEVLQHCIDVYNKISDKKIIFVIDAINQMTEDDDAKSYNWLLKEKNKNVKYILTCLKDTYFDDNSLITMEKLEFKLLSKESIRNILNYYNEVSTYKINNQVIERIIKNESTNNFLYLSFVLQRFKMFCSYDYKMIKKHGNDMQAINKHMLNIVEHFPKDLNYMCIHILEYATEIFDANIFNDVIGLIATSRYGLTPQELGKIFTNNNAEWNLATIKEIIYMLNDYFIIREDGRIDFSHQVIKQMIRQETLNKTFTNTNSSYITIITDYLLSLKPNNLLFVNEIMFYLWKEKRISEVSKVIIDVYNLNDAKLNDILVQELWKLFRVDNEWLENIQEYTLYHISNKDQLESYFLFFLIEFNRSCSNEYNYKLYMWLMDILETIISNANLKQINYNLFSIKEKFSLLIWYIKWLYSKDLNTRIENISKMINAVRKNKQTEYILNNRIFTIDEQDLNCKRINAIGKKNNNWHKERLKWIAEMNDERFSGLNAAKASTYYWLGDLENYEKFIKKELEERKNKLHKEKSFKNYKHYLDALFNNYTYFYCKPLHIIADKDKIEELIELSKRILKYEKKKFKENGNTLELAEAYILVAEQYSQLVYVDEHLQSGTKTDCKWTDDGKKETKTPIFINLKSLYTFDKNKALKYYKQAENLLETSLSKKLNEDECNKMLYELIVEREKAIKNDKKEKAKNSKKYDLYKIEKLRREVEKTLSFEDFVNYFEALPNVEPIYVAKKCKDIDELVDIYNQANQVSDLIEYDLYNDIEKKQLYELKKDNLKKYINVIILKNGINEDAMECIIDLYEDDYFTIFEYFKYQFIEAKNAEEKIGALNYILKYLKKEEEKIKNNNERVKAAEYIVSLYRIKRDAFIKIVEKVPKKIKDYYLIIATLLKNIIQDDLYLTNEIFVNIDLLINVLEDETRYINHQKEFYEKVRDLNILQDVFQHQDCLLGDYEDIAKVINLKFIYKEAITAAENIIKYQQDNKYFEKLEEYIQKIDNWENTLNNLSE